MNSDHPDNVINQDSNLEYMAESVSLHTQISPIQKHFAENSLPAVWASFLDKPEWHWEWYGHYTFRDVLNQYTGLKHHVHPETAIKTWDKFIHILNRDIYGVKYWKRENKGVVWARGTELQIRGAVHFHALIGLIPDHIRRLKYLDEWFIMAGIARIYPYIRGNGAEFYMSKSAYAWKRGEIDLGGPLADRLKKDQGELSF